MGIKFNCPNPECRRRFEVEDALAGTAMPCPVCGAEVHVPASHDIRFACTNRACGQHIVVEVSETGRHVRCPACQKILRVPGGPPKSMAASPLKPSPDRQRRKNVWFGGWKRLCFGWGIGTVVFGMLMGVFHFRLLSTVPPHLDEMAHEIYERGIWGRQGIADLAVRDKATIYYLQQMHADVNVMCVNRSSNQITQVSQIRAAIEDEGFRWLGWSPDRSLFAYCRQGTRREPELVLCTSNDGQTVESFRTGFRALVRTACWLSDKTIAFVDESNRVALANWQPNFSLGPDGTNSLAGLFALTNTITTLAPISGYSFAYTADESLWEYDVRSGEATELTRLGPGEPIALCFSPESKSFLIVRKRGDGSGGGLFRFHVEGGTLSLLEASADISGLVANEQFIAIPHEANGKTQFNVYSAGATNGVAFESGESLQSVAASDDDRVIYGITLNRSGGMALSIHALPTGDVVESITLQKRYRYAETANPERCFLTNEHGSRFEYYRVAPVGMKPGRKYPVFVDQTSSIAKAHYNDILLLVNSGIMYVSPNGFDISHWGITPPPENTMAVYKALISDPNVDSKRIYISGRSITTVAACRIVQDRPELWRGMVLFEPVVYPQWLEKHTRFPSVFMSIGLNDRYNGLGTERRAEKFLLDCCRRLIPARIDYQPGGHGFQGPQIESSYKAAIKFILSDY